jgi:hypothetical protein
MNIKTTDLDMPHVTSGRSLTLRAQCPSDRENLNQILPHDQVGVFEARYAADGNELVFTPRVEKIDPVDAERAKLTAASDKDLQTLAAKKGVKWDKSASRETMLDRILKAAEKPPEVTPTARPTLTAPVTPANNGA